MASNSTPLSLEEQAAMKAANNTAAAGMGNDGGHYAVGSQGNYAPGVGEGISMDPGGLSFQSDNVGGGNRGEYKYNPITGKYHNHGGDIVDVGRSAQQPQQTAAEPPKKDKPKKDWRDDIDYEKNPGEAGSSPGLETGGIVDNAGVNNWMANGPITEGQEINFLVDPNNWQTQLDPKHQEVRNLGRYINPGIDDWMLEQEMKQQGLLGSGQKGGLI